MQITGLPTETSWQVSITPSLSFTLPTLNFCLVLNRLHPPFKKPPFDCCIKIPPLLLIARGRIFVGLCTDFLLFRSAISTTTILFLLSIELYVAKVSVQVCDMGLAGQDDGSIRSDAA
jgi:hypothetical protein